LRFICWAWTSPLEFGTSKSIQKLQHEQVQKPMKMLSSLYRGRLYHIRLHSTSCILQQTVSEKFNEFFPYLKRVYLETLLGFWSPSLSLAVSWQKIQITFRILCFFWASVDDFAPLIRRVFCQEMELGSYCMSSSHLYHKF
jgi:hypothetical protein